MQASTSRSVIRSVGRLPSRQALPARSISTLSGSIARNEVDRPHLTASGSRGRSIGRRTFFSLPDITKLANLANAANEEQAIETDGEVQKFHAKKILPYTPQQLYSLVSNVPSYSSFIPFCTGSTVLAPPSSSSSPAGNPASDRGGGRRVWKEWQPDEKPFEVEAELKVGFGGLEEKYISKVVGRPFESVTATASEQTPLFKSLTTSWSFSPAPSSPLSSNSPDSTLLTIDLAFAFANPLHRIASQAVLPRVADKMVEAFEKRCQEEWGSK